MLEPCQVDVIEQAILLGERLCAVKAFALDDLHLADDLQEHLLDLHKLSLAIEAWSKDGRRCVILVPLDKVPELLVLEARARHIQGVGRHHIHLDEFLTS
jgi:hypothetical protein